MQAALRIVVLCTAAGRAGGFELALAQVEAITSGLLIATIARTDDEGWTTRMEWGFRPRRVRDARPTVLRCV